MSGYYNYSMSNNAKNAYLGGEMPLSKWTKSAILERVAEVYELDFECEKMKMLKKLITPELKEHYLRNTSWHHTSKMYNKTYFYDVVEYVDLDIEDIQKIIDARKPRTKKSPEVIKAEKAAKEAKKATKAVEEYKKSLFKYQNKYKTIKGFLKSNIDISELEKIRSEKIEAKRTELLKQWKSQNYIFGLNNINDDSFIESYIK